MTWLTATEYICGIDYLVMCSIFLFHNSVFHSYFITYNWIL